MRLVQPLALGVYPTPGWSSALAVDGALGYLVAGDTLHVIDLSSPSSPVALATLRIPGEMYEQHQMYRNSNEIRGLPGSIVVNKRGRRFANEALNYNDFVNHEHLYGY